MKHMILLVVILLLLLSACRPLTPFATPTLQPPAPTMTPAPTHTPIPATLDAPPQVIAADDLSLLSGDLMFQVTEASFHKRLGEQTSAPRDVYFVVYGRVFNYRARAFGFSDKSFPLMINDTPYILSPTLSASARALYADAAYPSAFGAPLTLVAPPKAHIAAVFVYTIPAETGYLQLGFDTRNGLVTMGLIVQPDADGRLTLIKVEENQESLVSIDLIPQDETLETVLDSEEVEVDNCYGTTEITRTFTFEKQESFKATVNASNRETEVSIGLGNRYIMGLLNERLTREFGELTLDQLIGSRTEELAAAVGTRPRWRMEWYLVSVKGIARVTIGDYHYDIPYTRTDRLRSDLVSIPSEPCP